MTVQNDIWSIKYKLKTKKKNNNEKSLCQVVVDENAVTKNPPTSFFTFFSLLNMCMTTVVYMHARNLLILLL